MLASYFEFSYDWKKQTNAHMHKIPFNIQTQRKTAENDIVFTIIIRNNTFSKE